MTARQHGTRLVSATRNSSGVAKVLLLALAIRLAVWAVVCRAGVAPIGDEGWYLSRAVAYEEIIRAYLAGATLPMGVFVRAYGNGVWPPLHPILMGVGFVLFGRSVVVARLVVLLQSVATVAVVYGLTARIASRRAARAAAVLFAVYPSFVALSHLLLSETTFILCWLAGLSLTIHTINAQRTSQRLPRAAFAGIMLGLAGLTRAAVLPLLILLLGVVFTSGPPFRKRFFAAMTMLVCAGIMFLPWEVTLWNYEGRFVPLSSAGGINLYEGHHPPPEVNDPWNARIKMAETVRSYAARHDVTPRYAAGIMALRYVRADPFGALRRCLANARSLWLPDNLLMRHLLTVTYPPLPFSAVALIWAVVVLALPTVLVLAVCGLTAPVGELQRPGLLVACVLAGMLPYVLTHTEVRYALPLLATLLPAAGVGLSSRWGRRHALCVGATLLAVYAVAATAPRRLLAWPGVASAYYTPLLRVLEVFVAPRGCVVRDQLLLRDRREPPVVPASVQLRTERYTLEPLRPNDSATIGADRHTATWETGNGQPLSGAVFWTQGCDAAPPTFEISMAPGQFASTFRPVDRQGWQRWQSSGINGLEWKWVGLFNPTDDGLERRLHD